MPAHRGTTHETASTEEPGHDELDEARARDDYDAEAQDEAVARQHDLARRRFGGTNWGACIFGWLVAIALTILLTSIIGAVLAAVGSNTNVTQSDAQRQAGTIGVAAAITLFVVLVVGYYAGGYVAGRMSRFDGARQGVGVWLIGLAVTVLAIALGAVFGHQYNLLDRVDLPRIPISTEQLGWGAVVTAAAVLVGTLLAAVLGGTVGRRYHAKVDHAVVV
jgi:amino acid transporter